MANAIEVLVPDIGGFKDVSIIELLVSVGQQVEKETPLITIETEKAAMDVPAPVAGRITKIEVKQGDKVSEGSLILMLEVSVGESAALQPQAVPRESTVTAPVAAAPVAAPVAEAGPSRASRVETSIDESAFSKAYASPSVRKFAREVGADLGHVAGTGPKARITQEDVKAYVKKLLSRPIAPVPGLPKVPLVDFAKFGAVEVKALSRIQKISGARLQASWINLPHVTQHDEADITELEIARAALKGKASQEEVRLTPLVFIVRACVLALRKYPRFNASLDASGENLVFKRYFHIGFAADTPEGLVVPVIHDADRLDLFETARALATLSAKARAGKLTAAEMQGGSFTISSLGGIGGTAFTPIINAPEVAILGVSKSSIQPVYLNGVFVPRLILPLSLSYDHRVIDGAEAARFTVFLSQTLKDPKAVT